MQQPEDTEEVSCNKNQFPFQAGMRLMDFLERHSIESRLSAKRTVPVEIKQALDILSRYS